MEGRLGKAPEPQRDESHPLIKPPEQSEIFGSPTQSPELEEQHADALIRAINDLDLHHLLTPEDPQDSAQ